ncbi:uncharacterized protein LOC136032406 [Artemia franciscana]|uniref:Uncharacterized protein n=1 Tax=Artemia franciscana TaxID=6661 RepID=A0AA88IBI6_ARTSF|nr:hypothetical protein QYM36_000589 [Artemia franciscana]
MKTQSKAKEVAEPAVETLAAETMKRQEATAVEEDAQRIKELGIDAKKEENLPEKYVKAKSKRSAKRAAAKSGTSQNGKKVEEKPIAEDCNKEGFREDFQKVGPKKLDATLPKLSRKDKKKLKKQKENDQTKSAASKTEGTGPSTCEDTFSLSLEQQSAKGQGALESAVDIKVDNCSNELGKILREYSQTRDNPVNESRNVSQSYWLMMEKINKNKTKEGNKEFRQEFFVNSKESQKESAEMTIQSNAKELAEPAVETLAAKTMKRQEATAVEEDAQRITGLEIDAKKEENLPEKYVKAKSKKSAKRAAAKSGTSQKGKQVEEKPIAEDCNKEEFREDFQKVGPKKLDATLPKLSRKDKKKLNKQKETDQTKSTPSKTKGAGPSTCEDTFSLSLEQQSAKG